MVCVVVVFQLEGASDRPEGLFKTGGQTLLQAFLIQQI